MAAETAMATPSSTSISELGGGGDCCLPFLPEEVCLQILQDLPVKSLVRFKLVCKSWLSTIQTPDFVNQHRRKHGRINDDTDGDFLVVYCAPHEDDNGDEEQYYPPCPPQYSLISPHSEHRLVDVKTLVHGCHPHSPASLPMLSFDGITCLSFVYQRPPAFDIHLWNPATQETSLLPHPQSQTPLQVTHPAQPTISVGFGFNFKTYDYKVIRIAHTYYSPVASSLELYSLNTHSWRTLDASSFPSLVSIFNSDIKRPLHEGRVFCWFATKLHQPKDDVLYHLILWFDFCTQEFGTVSFPVHSCDRTVSVTSGDKIISMNSAQDDMFSEREVWILNEFGVEESWTKLYHVQPFWKQTVSILDNRVSFLVVLNGCLCIHNTVTGETRKLPLQKKLYHGIDSIRYKQSLVSIKLANN